MAKSQQSPSTVCFYFELHQPYRLMPTSVFELGNHHDYFRSSKKNEDLNRIIFQKVAAKSYLPMLQLLLDLTKKHPEFVFTVSMSGVFWEQAKLFAPKVLVLLKKLVATGQVELLAETYYHSLACLYSWDEWELQVQQHHQLMKEYFNFEPKVFRNTELVYWDELAPQIKKLGYQAVLTEAVPRYLGKRSKTHLYQSPQQTSLPIFLKHAELSDDIAFRFSDPNWSHHPLTVDKYLDWLQQYGADEQINLFMDFETFGEHQWVETGIFDFFGTLIDQSIEKNKVKFVTPSQVIKKLSLKEKKELPVYDVPEPISWADVDRDLTAWCDNPLQQDTLYQLYALGKKIISSKNKKLIEEWRRLQTSDHFYYMCTKWAADGDVHAYFSPYKDPYEAYSRFATVLADLKIKLEQK